jgi:hypothetical protein
MVQEPVKPKKASKLPKSSNKAVDSAALNIVTTAPTIGGDGPTTDASASASGIKCNLNIVKLSEYLLNHHFCF